MRNKRASYYDDWEDDHDGRTAKTVYDSRPYDLIESEILDQHGEPIYHPRATVKFGFVP